MNTDRLLTRVFDKQEKRMRYSNKDYLGLNKEGIFTFDTCFTYFGDRFIPMLCLGWKDKNKKLIYAEDICKQGKDIFIVKYNYNYGRFEKEYITADFPVNELASTCVQPFWSGKPSCEIIGNICEDAHLLNRGEDASKNTKTN